MYLSSIAVLSSSNIRQSSHPHIVGYWNNWYWKFNDDRGLVRDGGLSCGLCGMLHFLCWSVFDDVFQLTAVMMWSAPLY